MNLVSSIISLLVVCKGGLTLGYDSNKLGVQNIPRRTLLSGSRFGSPNLKFGFSNLVEVFLWAGTNKIQGEVVPHECMFIFLKI